MPIPMDKMHGVCGLGQEALSVLSGIATLVCPLGSGTALMQGSAWLATVVAIRLQACAHRQ